MTNSKVQRHRRKEPNPDWTPFRSAEKKYKSQFPPPDISNVLDLARLNPARESEIKSGVWSGCTKPDAIIDISRETSNTKVYILPEIPGLVLLPGYLSHEKQKALVQWALSSQARDPNPSNLDVHYDVPAEGLWNVFLQSPDRPIDPLATESSPSQSMYEEESGPRKLVDNDPASSGNFTTLQSTPKPPAAPSPNAKTTPCSKLIRKLRWANIGWFYHWGTKQYDFSKPKAPIDEGLRRVCLGAVATVDWQRVFENTIPSNWGEAGEEWRDWSNTYEPDAGIVNFYQVKDTLMAHVDRSEVCATSPLVSISLGNAAIFLIGGSTRDTEPIPILLRSGDVVIMSGPGCRRAYHGVPRILEGTLPAHLSSTDTLDDPWQPYADYMKTTRININVRQVFPKGFNPELPMK